jgi:hypothetical protein
VNKLFAKLKQEPVRLALYSLATLVAGYLKTKGVLTTEDVAFIGSVAAVFLGVETLRSKVTPAKADEEEPVGDGDLLDREV